MSGHLDHIEQCIHTSPNRVRYSMNAAVIGIGSRGGTLQKEAIAAAKRIGKVEVDHGDTACQTPDAVSYIQKMAARKRPGAKSASQSTSKKSAGKKSVSKKAAATKPVAKRSTSRHVTSAARTKSKK